MATITAITNQKRGVGKIDFRVNFSEGLVKKRKKVLRTFAIRRLCH